MPKAKKDPYQTYFDAIFTTEEIISSHGPIELFKNDFLMTKKFLFKQSIRIINYIPSIK